MQLNELTHYVSWFSLAEWVGDLDSDNGGRLGLWQVCQKEDMSDSCSKQLVDLMSISSTPFQVGDSYLMKFQFQCTTYIYKYFIILLLYKIKVATIFVGLSVATAVLTIVSLVLMFFLKSTTVFHICGWMQILSGKNHENNITHNVCRNIIIVACLYGSN